MLNINITKFIMKKKNKTLDSTSKLKYIQSNKPRISSVKSVPVFLNKRPGCVIKTA
ncbi:hypothetical protein SPPR111872_04725 [Sphingobacterium prati]